MDGYKKEFKEPYYTYDQYKDDLEQKRLEDSFLVPDAQDATQEELEDLKLLLTLVFNSSLRSLDSKRDVYRRERLSQVQEVFLK